MLLKAFVGGFEKIHRLGSKGLTVLFLLLFLMVSGVFADSELLFDLRSADLNKEAFSLDGIVEFYDNQILDPGPLLDSAESSKQVIHFPMGLKQWSDRSAKESDLYGTLKLSALTSPELANTYLSLLVDLPAQEVKIWVNGNRLYAENPQGQEDLWNQKTSNRLSVVFPASGTKQEIIIQFKQLERKNPSTMAIVLGNPSAVNSLVNSRFIMDMFYVMGVAVILTFVFALVTLGRRHDSRRFRKLLHLVMLTGGISLLRFMAIDGNGLLFHLFGNYMDIYVRLKYAGLMLALPLLTIFMSRMPGVNLASQWVKLALPCFWFMTIVVLLGGSFQFEVIVKYYLLLEMFFCAYLLYKVAKNPLKKGQESYCAALIATVLVYVLLAISLFWGSISGQNSGTLQYALMILLFILQMGLSVGVTREKVAKVFAVDESKTQEMEVLANGLEAPQDGFTDITYESDSAVEKPAIFPEMYQAYSEKFDRLLWIVNRRGIVEKVLGHWPESIMNPEAICGSKAADILFPEDILHYEAFENCLYGIEVVGDSGLSQPCSGRCLWQGVPFKIEFLRVDDKIDDDVVLVKFEDITALEALENKNLELERQYIRYKKIIPEYAILRRVADDFVKYVRMDVVNLLDTYGKSEGSRRIYSELEFFKNLFAYYEMPKSSLYVMGLQEKISKMSLTGKEGVSKFLNDLAIQEDMENLSQSRGGWLNFDTKFQRFDMQNLDVLEKLLDTQPDDALKNYVRGAQRQKLDLLQLSLEGYSRYITSRFNCPLESFSIHIGDLQLNEGLFWDLHKMLIHLINNAVEHGFETEAEQKRGIKGGQNTLKIELDIVEEEQHEVLQLKVIDGGRGLPLDDIRSRLYADRKMSFEEVQQLPDELVIRQVLNPGFSMSGQRRKEEKGYGLHVVDEMAHRYGGDVEIISDGLAGTTVCVTLPYVDDHDHGANRQEMFLNALEQSLLNVAETVGFRSSHASSIKFYETKEHNVTLDTYTSIQSVYWHGEIQVIFTANKQLLETISHVYGVDFKELQKNETNDILNEIVNVTLSGALRSLSEKSHSITVGKSIHFESLAQLNLRAAHVFVASYSRLDMSFTAYVAVG